MSRYTDKATNQGVDDHETTKRRFKTSNMENFADKSPRTMPIFAISDVSKLRKIAE
jgi:hypothetical protein